MYEKSGDAFLTGYRVLDLTDVKGMFAVRLLSGMGVVVFRPSLEDKPGFLELVKTADVLIESLTPGYLASLGFSWDALSKINPRLIMASITHFGQGGKDLKSCDLVNQALGGWLSVTGEPQRLLKLPGNQSYNVASLFAVNGILLALWQRYTTGRGQYIDISILECVAASLDFVLPRYFYEGIVSKRKGSLHWNNDFRVFRCQDGYILLSIHQQWGTLVELMASENMANDLADAKWLDRGVRDRSIDHVIAVIERWTLTHKAGELEELGQLMRFPWAQVGTVQNG